MSSKNHNSLLLYMHTRYNNNVMLWSRNCSEKYIIKSVWIAQDTRESREPKLNVHSVTIQILAHTLKFSHGTLDSVVS